MRKNPLLVRSIYISHQRIYEIISELYIGGTHRLWAQRRKRRN